MDEPPGPEVRIGDRERRVIDTHLQQAHGDGVLTLVEYDERAAKCWAARTQSELDELVRDLPPYRPGPDEQPTVVVPEPAPAARAPGLGRRLARAAAVVVAAGGALFVGVQVAGADNAVAIVGDRVVSVGPGTERVEVGAIFGNVRVVVPEGMRASTSGGMVFGDTNCDQACSGPGPEVVVDVAGAFSDIDVVRPRELTADEAEELAEEQEDRIEDALEDDD